MADDPRIAVRGHLIKALEADLVGPYNPDTGEECLRLPPSRWYLTGFLAPERCREPDDPTADEQVSASTEDDEDETPAAESEPKRPRRYPASLGLSVLLPPSSSADEAVRVQVQFAEYIAEERSQPDSDRPARVWVRHARNPPPVSVRLDEARVREGVMVPDTPGVWVRGKLQIADAPGLPAGTRALSLFVVNQRVPPEERRLADEAFLFQVGLELHFERGFVARPNLQGEEARDWDDRVADLQFRQRMEYAVGHGVAVEVPEGQGGRVQTVRTTWLPRHEVRRVVTHDEPAVETGMEALGRLETPEAVAHGLKPLDEAYGKWLTEQAAIDVTGAHRRQTQQQLIEKAQWARSRVRAGIERLQSDPLALEAFRLTNQAMATAALKRSPERYSEDKRPAWRLFQLAFVLLNVPGIMDEDHPDRETVDLIFFPTGGGKTEAYLGVIAFTLLLRRLKGQARPDGGLGVAVLLRYTLRLLTLDQLGRAATLVCALESLRQAQPERLGAERYCVGLWVGKSATANTLEQLKKEVLNYKNSTSPNAVSPFPLAHCPWCGERLSKDSIKLEPNASKAERIVVGCSDFRCDFSPRRNPSGLPVLFVDEQIYRELPAFLVATVDKFAMLPWRGETGKLFGRVQARDKERLFGPMDAAPSHAAPLPEGLRPPELIVQDELHLISGPLGTMTGLYETAIEWLCTRRGAEGKPILPKLIASTATVRRAREQIQALFGRRDTELFPPPGVDDSETFFAKVDTTGPGRLYVGVAAPGRSLKGLLLRSYVAALCAGYHQYKSLGPGAKDERGVHYADPYLTLAGYFNALRELGGMRRLVEDEVQQLCQRAVDKRPLDAVGEHRWFARRKVQLEPVELTSRESTLNIKATKDRLATEYGQEGAVDVLLASNMISVGVDIDRLGLMVIAGQPKTTAEYIQASSRVGRQHPGMVLTCFNINKSRDRSHYERFSAYHESFYRFVEATSLTPFSGPALDRGLAGIVVAMVRLGEPAMTDPGAVMKLQEHRERLAAQLFQVLEARVTAQPGQRSDADNARWAEHVKSRAEKLLDCWAKIVHDAQHEGATRRRYSQFDRDATGGRPLLSLAVHSGQDDRSDDERRFVAPTSMRDVEESVHLWIERRRNLGETNG